MTLENLIKVLIELKAVYGNGTPVIITGIYGSIGDITAISFDNNSESVAIESDIMSG